jgi:hypothetical protein
MAKNIDGIRTFLHAMDGLTSENLMGLVENFLSDEDIEVFVEHIERFYGVDDDEELGLLAQIMITGYLSSKAENEELNLGQVKN